MPDGDRFERSLRGKGWRKGYRQACGEAPLNILGDTIVTSTAAALRDSFACDSLPPIRDAVLAALARPADIGQDPVRHPPLNFSVFISRLDQIVQGSATPTSSKLASSVAQSVYLELQPLRTAVSKSQVEDCLARSFGEKVIRNQFLARVREGLVLRFGRTAEAQMAWEADLIRCASARLKKMIVVLFCPDRTGEVRAPRRSTPQRKMTIAELNQGISVLEG